MKPLRLFELHQDALTAKASPVLIKSASFYIQIDALPLELFPWHLQGRLEGEISVKKTALSDQREFVVFSEGPSVRMVVGSYRP